MNAAEMDLSEVLAENDKLRAIVAWVADIEVRHPASGGCPICVHRRDETHRPDGDCPVAKARKALGR